MTLPSPRRGGSSHVASSLIHAVVVNGVFKPTRLDNYQLATLLSINENQSNRAHFMSTEPSVVLIGDYDYDYPREKNVRGGLEKQGVTVHDCQFSRTQRFIGPTKLLLMPLFYVRTWFRLRAILEDDPDPDALFVTKFNPLILPLAFLFARRIGCPLVYDLFVSLYRTAEMRDVNPVLVFLLRTIEHVALKIPDYHTVGTNQFIELYSEMYSIPADRFIRLPPGADEDWYYPMDDIEKRTPFTALYWGNFLPHHGVEVIVEAARKLCERDSTDIEIVFVGKGPRKEQAEELVEEYNLENVTFEGFVPMESLQRWIASSHVALGVFSPDKRAMASITNKVSEGVAMKKAVITERSPAIEEWFVHGESIYTVPPADPNALADGIEDCRNDSELVARLERGAYEVYERSFSQSEVGAVLVRKLGLEST